MRRLCRLEAAEMFRDKTAVSEKRQLLRPTLGNRPLRRSCKLFI